MPVQPPIVTCLGSVCSVKGLLTGTGGYLAWRWLNRSGESGQVPPVADSGGEYLLDALLRLIDRQVDETLTVGQVPSVVQADEYADDLYPASDGDHLRVPR